MKSIQARLHIVLLVVLTFCFLSPASAEGASNSNKKMDAAVVWDNGKAYFFKGSQYIRYDVKADRADAGYPQSINEKTWPGVLPLLDRENRAGSAFPPKPEKPTIAMPEGDRKPMVPKDYQNMASSFIRNLLDGNYPKAFALTHDRFRQFVTEKDLADFRRSLPQGGKQEFVSRDFRQTANGSILTVGLLQLGGERTMDIHCLFQEGQIVYVYGR